MSLELVKRDVRTEAARLIERDGWCQGRNWGDHGERCMRQALEDAAVEVCLDPEHHPGDVLRDIWADLWIELQDSVLNWQDQPGRTPEQVTAALRAGR